MNRRGFSLVELLVVITLMGILLALATFGFSQYSTRSQIAGQTRQLNATLLEYRAKALYEKKEWTLKFSTAGYGVYSSSNVSVAPVSSVVLKFPVTSNNTANIIFNSQGLANVSSKSICISAANQAPVDSVVLSKTRAQIGKKREGADCDESNIDAK